MATPSDNRIADAFDSTVEEISSRTAEFTDGAAKVIDGTARYLRDSQATDMLAGLESKTKANPLAFLLGALAVGFVAGRMLRRG
jgi:hypothetical protein